MTQRFYAFFFFNDTATTEIYTLSLHDALPISSAGLGPTSMPSASMFSSRSSPNSSTRVEPALAIASRGAIDGLVSTSTTDRKSTRLNLQSRQYLVCRLLLETNKPLHFCWAISY